MKADVIISKMVADKLTAYLRHELELPEFVDWAENVMREGGFEEEHYERLRNILSRLGPADVKTFGLTWEDCREFLSRLGYSVRVDVAGS